jgi:ceramide glucosyltransferase
MVEAIAGGLLVIAAVGLSLLAVQVWVLVQHLRVVPPQPTALPGISILKPLCGVDDDLEQNLATFARLDYPRYEVLLGVRDASDPAYRVACRAVAAAPDRVRVVLQRGEPGLNPKVNQLITLAQRARHDLLVISDSNVAAHTSYLQDIAGYLGDPRVGLVTHPVAGCGERTLGALMDNAHLSTGIAPGMVAAKRIANFPIVVGKSMALRRADVHALGGFASVKDVLAEDFVLGRRVERELRKHVVVANRPIAAVSRTRGLRAFYARYVRWGTIQRTSVGPVAYAGLLLLHPLPVACIALIAHPSGAACAVLAGVWMGKALLERAAARALRGSSFALCGWLALPLKDAILLAAWVGGLCRSEVDWRGNRLAVLDGTRLRPLQARPAPVWRLAPASMRFFATRLFR